MNSLKYRIHTFGCKVNTYDSGLLESRFSNTGFKSDYQEPHIHILNTCAVTLEATKEAQRLVRRIKSKNPFAMVVVTGCGAQVDTEKFSNMSGVDLVVANSHKGEIDQLIHQFYKGELKEKVFKSNIFKKIDLEPGGGKESAHTRSFLKIQDGCDSFCTYCVIPFARGKSRSLDIDYLVNRVLQLESEGVKEVVLTGVHIGDYLDSKYQKIKGPEKLIKELLIRTKNVRFRVGSLEPIEVTDELLELFKEDKVCSHFHMSIQSGSTSVLKDMKRNYTSQEVEKSLLNIEKNISNAYVGMDVIVGFPTETEEKFEEGYRLLESLPWTRAHVFPYSQRPGTYASHLAKVNKSEEIKERAFKLRELSKIKYTQSSLNIIGQIFSTLTLKSSIEPHGIGLTDNFWPLVFEGQNFTPGKIINAKILGIGKEKLNSTGSPLRARLV